MLLSWFVSCLTIYVLYCFKYWGGPVHSFPSEIYTYVCVCVCVCVCVFWVEFIYMAISSTFKINFCMKATQNSYIDLRKWAVDLIISHGVLTITILIWDLCQSNWKKEFNVGWFKHLIQGWSRLSYELKYISQPVTLLDHSYLFFSIFKLIYASSSYIYI